MLKSEFIKRKEQLLFVVIIMRSFSLEEWLEQIDPTMKEYETILRNLASDH